MHKLIGISLLYVLVRIEEVIGVGNLGIQGLEGSPQSPLEDLIPPQEGFCTPLCPCNAIGESVDVYENDIFYLSTVVTAESLTINSARACSTFCLENGPISNFASFGGITGEFASQCRCSFGLPSERIELDPEHKAISFPLTVSNLMYPYLENCSASSDQCSYEECLEFCDQLKPEHSHYLVFEGFPLQEDEDKIPEALNPNIAIRTFVRGGTSSSQTKKKSTLDDKSKSKDGVADSSFIDKSLSDLGLKTLNTDGDLFGKYGNANNNTINVGIFGNECGNCRCYRAMPNGSPIITSNKRAKSGPTKELSLIRPEDDMEIGKFYDTDELRLASLVSPLITKGRHCVLACRYIVPGTVYISFSGVESTYAYICNCFSGRPKTSALELEPSAISGPIDVNGINLVPESNNLIGVSHETTPISCQTKCNSLTDKKPRIAAFNAGEIENCRCLLRAPSNLPRIAPSLSSTVTVLRNTILPFNYDHAKEKYSQCSFVGYFWENPPIEPVATATGALVMNLDDCRRYCKMEAPSAVTLSFMKQNFTEQNICKCFSLAIDYIPDKKSENAATISFTREHVYYDTEQFSVSNSHEKTAEECRVYCLARLQKNGYYSYFGDSISGTRNCKCFVRHPTFGRRQGPASSVSGITEPCLVSF